MDGKPTCDRPFPPSSMLNFSTSLSTRLPVLRCNSFLHLYRQNKKMQKAMFSLFEFGVHRSQTISKNCDWLIEEVIAAIKRIFWATRFDVELINCGPKWFIVPLSWRTSSFSMDEISISVQHAFLVQQHETSGYEGALFTNFKRKRVSTNFSTERSWSRREDQREAMRTRHIFARQMFHFLGQIRENPFKCRIPQAKWFHSLYKAEAKQRMIQQLK